MKRLKVDLRNFLVKIDTGNVPREFQESDHSSDYNPTLTVWNVSIVY